MEPHAVEDQWLFAPAEEKKATLEEEMEVDRAKEEWTWASEPVANELSHHQVVNGDRHLKHALHCVLLLFGCSTSKSFFLLCAVTR